MSIVVNKNQSWAVQAETTEGTYAAPASATAFVQTLADGAELSRSKETLERNIFTSSIGQTSPRTGQFTVSGSIPTEARAHSTEGAAPEFSTLMESALGDKRQLASAVTTKSSGNTGSSLKIEDADIEDFAIGDIILIKEAGAYHVSPISSVTTTPGSAAIGLLVSKPSGSFSASVVIAKHTTYVVADSGHPSFSVSRYLNSAVLQKATGCRVNSMSLEGFETGQIPSFNFGFEGLNFDSSLTAPPYTPSYDSQVPPIILAAGAYMDGTAIDINSLAFSLENTVGFETSISAENGRVSGRATERRISGSFNPYMKDDTIANFTKFKNNTAFSIFAYAKVPTGVAGQFSGIVAVYMPNCIITELGEADQDGLLQDSISFSANRGNTGSTAEIYVSFI